MRALETTPRSGSSPAFVLGAAVLMPLLCLGRVAGAQAGGTPPCPGPAAGPHAPTPPATAGQPVDVAIYAAASVREVRFARQPEIRVRLCGGLDSMRVVERRNLPSPVVAGRTYRDVYVAVEILGRIDAACLTRRLGVGPDARDTTAAPGPALRADCASVTIGGAAAPPEPAARRNELPPGTDSAPASRTPTPSRP